MDTKMEREFILSLILKYILESFKGIWCVVGESFNFLMGTGMKGSFRIMFGVEKENIYRSSRTKKEYYSLKESTRMIWRMALEEFVIKIMKWVVIGKMAFMSFIFQPNYDKLSIFLDPKLLNKSLFNLLYLLYSYFC
jgi:hypothetical protein